MKSAQVFEGIKVADFSWVGVGPSVARELAEHGATVVHVESHRSPDTLRLSFPYKDGKPGINRSAFGTLHNTNKYGMSVDLSKPGGQEVARRLIAWADIVTEGFTPGTMAKFGLDYGSVAKIKPSIIYYSTNQQGQYGPHCKLGGFGTQGGAGAGFYEVCGWPDRDPVYVYGAYTDYVSPWLLLVPVIGALLDRRRTGRGIYLDQAQYEAAISFLGPAILDYGANGRITGRVGNRSPRAVPHSSYPCMGADRWVAISLASDGEWQAFCKVIGRPEWTRDPRFATFLGRKRNEDELDRLVSEWTVGYTAEEVMLLMQGAGIPAAVVSTCQDLFEDTQLKHRHHYVLLNHKEMGPHHYRAPAYKLSKTPSQLVRPAPCLGEHNEFVYKEILGYSDDDVANMLAEGVITTEHDAPVVVRPKEPPPAKA